MTSRSKNQKPTADELAKNAGRFHSEYVKRIDWDDESTSRHSHSYYCDEKGEYVRDEEGYRIIEPMFDLNESNWREIPDWLTECTNLEFISLYDFGTEKSKSLFLSLSSLQRLQTIITKFVPIRFIPQDVCRLTNLRVLELESCAIGNESIHPAFWDLHLSVLTIRISYLTDGLCSIPRDIERLKDTLLYLNLELVRKERGSGVVPFPREIGELSRLTSLSLSFANPDISNTFSYELPFSFEKMADLKYLQLHSLYLTSLSPSIGDLSSLSHLSLTDNLLSTLPSDLCRCKQLRFLELEGNLFSSLPPCIGELTGLIYLHIDEQSLRSRGLEEDYSSFLSNVDLSALSFLKSVQFPVSAPSLLSHHPLGAFPYLLHVEPLLGGDEDLRSNEEMSAKRVVEMLNVGNTAEYIHAVYLECHSGSSLPFDPFSSDMFSLAVHHGRVDVVSFILTHFKERIRSVEMQRGLREWMKGFDRVTYDDSY